jgi:23S rRNA (guanosine2251-2'-O)-methyltransferase
LAKDRNKPRDYPSNKPKKRGKPRNSRGGPSENEGWIYGIHAVEAALANKRRKIHRLLATKNAAQNLKIAPEIEIEISDPSQIDSLLPSGAVHQGLALKADPLEPVQLEAVLSTTNTDVAPLLVLDQVSDPHNVGAILRSAAAFGAAAVIVQDRHAPHITGILTKTASGAVEQTPIVRVTNLSRALEQIAEAGYFRVGLAGEAEETLGKYDLPNKIALVLGAEGPGLRRLTREKCDVLLRLPTQGPVSSLNVSNAAAVALYAVSTASSS